MDGELNFQNMLPVDQRLLLDQLHRVERCGPRLPTQLKDVATSRPWSEERLAAFRDLLAIYKHFRALHGDEPCPPQIVRFLRFWMRLDHARNRWELRHPRGRPYGSKDDGQLDDPNDMAAHCARKLRGERRGPLKIEVGGKKVTPLEAAIDEVDELFRRRGDPRRCDRRQIKQILRRGSTA
jgi:hypothetical protein